MENNLRVKDLKIIHIGNSRGIRIPKKILEKYGFGDSIVLEETDRGILLRHKEEENKLSWEETFKAMAEVKEDWNDFDIALLDGLEDDDIDTEKV